MLRVAMSAVGFLATRAGGAALATRKMAQARGTVNMLAEDDLARLHLAGSLDHRAAPCAPARPVRSRVGRFLLGMLLGGVLVTVVFFSILVAYSGVAPDPIPLEKRIVGGFFLALLGGAVGLFVPGLGFGSLMVLREMFQRMDDDAKVELRSYWNSRERVRASVAAGTMSPAEASARLSSYSR